MPRRDWFLLPGIGILTICVIVFSCEAIGTLMIPRQGKPLAACLIQNDPVTGIRGVPNSTCWNRLLEGPLVENRFNSCGDRTNLDCDHKAPGAYRIVLAGASFVFGLGVDNKSTVATLLPVALSQDTQRKIEVYNVGMEGKWAHGLAAHFDHVLAAKPDMIVWVVTPTDIKNSSFIVPDVDHPAPQKADASARKRPTGPLAKVRAFFHKEFAGKSLPDALAAFSEETRTGFLLRHYLYKSQSLYVRNYLMGMDDAGYLRAEPNAEWQARLQTFDGYAAQIVSQSKAAGIPLAVVLVPGRAQSAMISMNDWPPGFDPYALDQRLRSFFTSQGVYYLDILPGFRTIPNPEQYYFPADGHPNAGGHVVIAKLLASQLTSGVIPQLKAESPAPLLAKGR